MNKRIAIVNNKCCRAKKNGSIRYIIDRIKKETDADIAFTEYPGHAEKIANEASGHDIIIAVGGDGTVSEVINGMKLGTQKLAIIPFGSANSFARDLGLTSFAKALYAIRKGETVKIDLIDCQFKINGGCLERYCIATSGLGFASRTCDFANRYLKMTGPFCYSISASFKLFNQEVIRAKLQIDDSSFEKIEFTNLLINNTKHAGNALVFPKAGLRDSLLNLLFTKTNALTQFLWSIGIITKTYFYYPGEKIAKRLRIVLDKPSHLMLDGEIFNSIKEIYYSVAPQKLTVLK